MIERPYWRCNRSNPDDSPFKRGKDERALGLTIHAPADCTSVIEDQPLALIRELVHLEQLEWADTATEARCRLTVDPSARVGDGYGQFTVVRPDDRTVSTSIFHPDIWTSLVDRYSTPDVDRDALATSLFVAAAHEAMHHDLLITTAPDLLRMRRDPDIRHLNICPPSEAVKLVGLFLRSREQFVYAASSRHRASVDSWSFYLVLRKMAFDALRTRPERPQTRAVQDPIAGGLGESISLRCRRAIEARDAIGIQFYLREDNRTQDVILYHFDYLTLLLTGAFDACLLLAKHICKISIDDKRVGFWRDEFRNKSKVAAPRLDDVLNSDRANALRFLLFDQRNTIHKARLKSLGYQEAGRPRIALVKLGEYGPAARVAAEKLGGCERWGMMLSYEFPFEPYSYTLALLDESFCLISDMLEAIEPPSTKSPEPEPVARPIPGLFNADQMRRIGLLG